MQAALMAFLIHNAANAGIDGGGAWLTPGRDESEAHASGSHLDALLVSIAINGRLVADSSFVFRENGNAWLVPDSLLSAAGVKAGEATEEIDGIVYRRLQASSDLSFRYDAPGAALSLIMAPSYFERRTINIKKESPPATQGETIPAAFFDYDLGARYASGDFNVDGTAGVGVSGAFGVARSQWAFSSAGDPAFIRLGSSLTIDDPDRRTTLVIGDGVEASAPGLAPLSFGGIGWYSNFEIDPDFIALPLPSITGVAHAPGRINVFVNDQEHYSGEVGEGDFIISDLPATVGAAQLRVVATDLTGRTTSFVEPVYVAPDLLKPGLPAYSFAAGWDRLDSGDDSIEYGALFARAGYRRGLLDWLTVNAAGEGNGDVANARVGADLRLGALGAASFGVGASHSMENNETGYSFEAAVNRSAGDLSFGVGAYYASRNFGQIGLLPDARLKTRYDGHASLRIAGGTFSAGASFMDRWGEQSIRLARFGYTRDLGPGQVTLGGFYIAGEVEASEFRAAYTVPFGGGGFASSQLVRSNDGAVSGGLAAGRSPPPGEGVGYGVNLDVDEKSVDARAQLALRKNTFEGLLEGVRRDGKVSARARLRGGLVLADGALFASRDAGKGALLVETPDLDETPVHFNNQELGRTRKDGKALIPAQPFARHVVALDESALPIETALNRSSVKATTGRGRVTKVGFSLVQNFAETVVMTLPDGALALRGTPIVAAGDPEPLPVGHDGLAYLTSDAPDRRYTLVTEEGRCAFTVDFEELKSQRRERGAMPVVVCEREGGERFVEESNQDKQQRQALSLEQRAKGESPAPRDKRLVVARPALRWGADWTSAYRHSQTVRYGLMAIVTFADGRDPPRGTPLYTNGSPTPFAVGYDGLVFLAADSAKQRYSLSVGERSCAFDVYFDNLRTGEEGGGAWPVYVCG